jgi:hypothetical protein
MLASLVPPIFFLISVFGLLYVGGLLFPKVHRPQGEDDELGEWNKASDRVASVVVSLLILLANLYVISSRQYGPDDARWAYGSLGTIVGFWVRK